jgi:hypothetical protein
VWLALSLTGFLSRPLPTTQVRREEYRTTRDKESFEKIRREAMHANASGATRGLKPADIVALYEGKREAAERDLSELRAEVKQLSQELRERDNMIACVHI